MWFHVSLPTLIVFMFSRITYILISYLKYTLGIRLFDVLIYMHSFCCFEGISSSYVSEYECVCVFACVYIYIYIYIYTHTHVIMRNYVFRQCFLSVCYMLVTCRYDFICDRFAMSDMPVPCHLSPDTVTGCD